MDEVFYGNPLSVINNELSPIDLYNIKFVNKTLNDKIDCNLIKISINGVIYDRLKSIFDDVYMFLDLLDQCNGVISDSFILQCILEETWENI